jgi:formylmethanofuran dehydrogenase subunit D
LKPLGVKSVIKVEDNLGENFILITGRTRKQAEGLHKGKGSEAYRKATALVEMSREDMERLGIEDGRMVVLKTLSGQVEVPVRNGSLPLGILFIPMGPAANVLIGAETEGTGMPEYKGLNVNVELT